MDVGNLKLWTRQVLSTASVEMIEIYDLNKENKYNTVQFNNLKSRNFYLLVPFRG